MAVTRYQFRLSIYLATVVITALGAASPRIVKWAVRGRPPEYVSVEIDGKQVLFEARVWPTHPLDPNEDERGIPKRILAGDTRLDRA